MVKNCDGNKTFFVNPESRWQVKSGVPDGVYSSSLSRLSENVGENGWPRYWPGPC